jgi:hypothetical protein
MVMNHEQCCLPPYETIAVPPTILGIRREHAVGSASSCVTIQSELRWVAF